MFNTLADWIYNAKKYVRLDWDEVVGFIVTSVFASFIITFDDWGTEVFDPAAGVKALLTMAFFLFIVFFVSVILLKFLGLRFGYQMKYQPHLIGLMFGLVISVASAGYLPIFLTGGFHFSKPHEMYLGHWRGYNRTYEVAGIAGAFPMLMIFYMIILNGIYLATGNEMIVRFVGALALVAVFSLIPLPNVALSYGGRVLDFFRYLRGETFGLQVYFNSRTWYMALVTFVLFNAILAYIVTSAGGKVSLAMYALVMILALLVMWVYKTFIEHAILDRTRGFR